MPDTSSTRSEDVLTQLVTGPSLREVATNALRTALEAAYPSLVIDPVQAIVVTPTWSVSDNQVTPDLRRSESLTDALVRLTLSAQTATYIDGEHFLTLQPGVEPAIHLPVKIEDIGRLINQLIPLLFVSYQEQQLDYWNQQTENETPRWYQLSGSLHNLWNIEQVSGWDEDQKAMALTLFNNPDKATRQRNDPYTSRACLIDFDEPDKHLWLLDVAVLVGTLGKRTLVISHSITEGFKHYDSLESFGNTLSARVRSTSSSRILRWRLYEPTGNFFDHQACALIALEITAIGQLHDTITNGVPARRVITAVKNRKAFDEGRFRRIEHLLPDWLLSAQPADLTCYSRHLMDLALLREQQAGKSFLDDIPPLPAFTLQALKNQVLKDHPQTTDARLETIELSITSPVILGAIAIPGKTETVTMSLIDLALQNLIAVPLGNKTVRRTDGSAVESWMTPAYLETLVTEVNIGQTYPRLIKQKLLGDAKETQRRQNLFASHLRIQLPLQTLQHKIRGEAGIDDQGYRYVVAALQEKLADRFVDGQEIIIRPLAFIPGGRTNNQADEVANMFIIGPRLADRGPCLLFRPLLDPPLLQYPRETNLLYAIKHHQRLRQSVLAWLPEDVRFNYSQYVFPGQLPSVWTLSQWLVDPTSALGMMGSVRLAATPLAQPSLSALFTANANAMITLADRQSVSNAQSRWQTLKHGAWALFNIALPFLGKTAASAAWVWQIMSDLDEANEASEKGDTDDVWTALTDLFLSLGMVLAHYAATRHTASRVVEKAPLTLGQQPTPRPTTTVTRLPDITSQRLPADHKTNLYTHGALARASLGTLLDGLAIAKPAGLASPSTEVGPHRFLSLLNKKWYAQVGQCWFEVMVNDNEFVQIIDTRQSPPGTGPLLTHSASGQWVVDTRLRLRGGGRSRIKLVRENARRKDELRKQLETFDTNKIALKTALESAEKAAISSAPGVEDANSRKLIDTLDQQLAVYGVYIEQLKAFNVLESIINYRAVLVSCLDQQLLLTEMWCHRQNAVFGACIIRSLALFDGEPIESTQTRRQLHQQTSDLTQSFIDKIEFAQARIDELQRLGREGAETAREYTKGLPDFDLHDLKLFQISLAQELCLNDTGMVATEAARQALVTLVEDVGVTILSSLDLAKDILLSLPERIEGFSDLVEQFSTIDQRILDLPDEFPGQLLQPSLDLMRQRIEVFNERTVNHLAALLHERKTLEPVPGPSRPAMAPYRLIKTRVKGTVVGKPRTRVHSTDTDLVDVTSPLTGKVIATYHEKTPGVWVEHVPVKTAVPAVIPPTLAVSVQNGEALLSQLESFVRRTEAHSKADRRIPLEIEEMFHQQAGRMEEAGDAIEEGLTDKNATESGPGSAVTVAKMLNDEATALYKKGTDVRISMTKRQLPTAGRVEWLHSKGEVTIHRIGKPLPEHRRLKGPRKDFLDEYEIRDHQTRKVLWYAHFHYPAADSPRTAFTAAHLKTVEQRGSGGAYERHTRLNALQSIAIYRAEINHRLADALFFL
ncbi:dermonecrotic toxin domain-containing protein [Pseudomonas fluorescens]|uniref:Dermonecrotic toxin N-terminal domain-containing protein n=1 Tax=Pseudomonas fluorescens TaxID=294 RepID=A0A5E7JCD3_PSEFL|nr:DUF6543 domain-containing protein [Pseudomonas fluorescens]VVO85726.1 hypothetical protein PS880_02039 [Pseudomonas fluorescens]